MLVIDLQSSKWFENENGKFLLKARCDDLVAMASGLTNRIADHLLKSGGGGERRFVGCTKHFGCGHNVF